jgi:twitching motility protein PilT
VSEVLASVRLGEVLRMARSRNASDLHICAEHPPVLRVDGALETQGTTAPSLGEIESLATTFLGDRATARLEREGDASAAYRDDELGSFRVHAFRSSSGIALAIRVLAPSVPTLESLHLPAVVASFAEKSNGLVLFAGPTGSGKSTVLAALIDRINRTQAKHILTAEDPIEYRHRSLRSVVSQREVGRDVGSFADAIYGALRSDPDVLLVGEMRDSQTMHAALTAAETGHLVFATLHTGDGPQTIDRIISAFNGDMQEQVRVALAQTLLGAVCLRLVPRTAGRGRRCAAEVLVATDAVRSIVRDGKTHQLRNAIATGRAAGMQTLETHLSDLVMRREISLETAKGYTERPGEIRPLERGTVA